MDGSAVTTDNVIGYVLSWRRRRRRSPLKGGKFQTLDEMQQTATKTLHYVSTSERSDGRTV